MTRSDPLPLDERGQIPGQLEIEVTEDMTEGPRRASSVENETKLTEEQLAAQKRRREVQARIAKRTALKKAGADIPTSSPDLHAKLEDSAGRIAKQQMENWRKKRTSRDTKDVVAARLKKNRP